MREVLAIRADTKMIKQVAGTAETRQTQGLPRPSPLSEHSGNVAVVVKMSDLDYQHS